MSNTNDVRFITAADGTKIAYAARGVGPDLVFARGWLTHLTLAEEDPAVRAFLARLERQYRVIRYDGRGNGLSQRELPSTVTVHHLVEDLEAVTDAACEADFTLWGSSWAGPAAIVYATMRPERVNSLILDGTFAVGSALTTPERAASFLTMLATARHQPDAVYASLSYITDPDPVMSHKARVARVRASIDPDALLQLYTLLYDIDVSDYLPHIDRPTLVMHRTNSKSVPVQSARYLAQRIESADLAEFDGQSHNLWEGDTSPMWTAVADFLQCPELATAPRQGQQHPVSVVCIDQAASTKQMLTLGDEHGVEVQSQMIEILYHAAGPFGAEHFSDTGDGLVFLVPVAADAVALSQVIQKRIAVHNQLTPASEHLHLRIGVHTGTVQTARGGRTSGLAIAIAARLCDLSEPDQILVSDETKTMAADAIGHDSFIALENTHLDGAGQIQPHRVDW